MSALSTSPVPQQLSVLGRYLSRLGAADVERLQEVTRKVCGVLRGEEVDLREEEETAAAAAAVGEGPTIGTGKALSTIAAALHSADVTEADVWAPMLNHLAAAAAASTVIPEPLRAESLSDMLQAQKNGLQRGFVNTELLAATVDAAWTLSPEDVAVQDLHTMVFVLSRVGVAEVEILYKLRRLWLSKMAELDLGTIVAILDLFGHAKVPDHELFLTASEARPFHLALAHPPPLQVLQLSADNFTLPQCISLLRSCARCGEFHVRLFHCIFARMVTLLPTADVTVQACGAIMDSMAALRARDDRVLLAAAMKLNQLLEPEGTTDDPDATRTLLDLQHVSFCLRALSKLGFVQPSTLQNLMATCRRCFSSNILEINLDLASLLSHSINRLGLYDPVVAWHLHVAVRRCMDHIDTVQGQTDARLVAALSACYNCTSAFPQEVEHHFQSTAVKIVKLILQRHRENGTEMKSRAKASLHTALLAIIPTDPSRVVLEAAELDPQAVVTSAVEESSSGLMKEVLQALKGLQDELAVQEEVHAAPFSIDLVLQEGVAAISS
ncbi:hypothetical protein FOZ63_033167 [Perkinsus olseni]|uniref:Uncharacterized protein n=1 Tax=Perkinsus olseni TaxID=32597 RepID=A0A7J6RKC4_PEROL|nr:hypothetical protein FOZ63_033167 [Perkinsus olseni]